MSRTASWRHEWGAARRRLTLPLSFAAWQSAAKAGKPI